MSRRTKASDLAARLGGDEFAVVLPDCTAADAGRVAERVRAEFGRVVGTLGVTLSAGVASIPEHASDVDELIAAADGALYEAKRGGRDRVAVAGAG
jgi:diguanylate cyclase (GGDEF)-like protein